MSLRLRAKRTAMAPVSLRTISSDITIDSFKRAYKELKSGVGMKYAEQLKATPQVNPQGVFGNNNCSLRFINAYGFDYDHTLANYNRKSGRIIYENAMNYLINYENYPVELAKMEFNPNFAIRGLQLDRLNGNVMKLNQFHKLNPRTIYNGHDNVSIETILEQYGGLRISEHYFERHMKDLGDLFGVPETCLYCDVIQFLKNKQYDFEYEYIADDIQRAINYVHDGGHFHRAIAENPQEYVQKLPRFADYIRKLKDHDKKIFVLTNSSFGYIDKACQYLFEDVVTKLGVKRWTDIFDYTIVSARKPKWFAPRSSGHGPTKFRALQQNGARSGSGVFRPVDELEVNGVYTGGSLEEFHRLTQIRNDQVIYFGDNVGSDLSGPSKTGQWKTVAIIKELEREIKINNDVEFRKTLSYLLDVEHLWFDAQQLRDEGDEEVNSMLDELSAERGLYRTITKEMYNKQFGSIFRTHSTRTLFFHRLARYSDLYTSKVTNFLAYPIHYKFGARRQFYDHEPVL